MLQVKRGKTYKVDVPMLGGMNSPVSKKKGACRESPQKVKSKLLLFFSVYFLSPNLGIEEAKCLNSLHNFPWSIAVGKFSYNQQGMGVSGKADRH